MAMADPIETSSPSPTHFSQPRHFYIAVARIQFKMETLVDLLGLAGRCRPGVPIVVCCSSRDELDAVCFTLSSLPYVSLSSLYSDMAESERALVLEKFREAAVNWEQCVAVETGDDGGETGQEEPKSHVIVVTDACLPLVTSGESPIIARVLINYELPTKKEIYARRMATCLAPDGILINMVVGGEVATLRAVEEGSGLVIAEMPIDISEIL